MEELEEKQISVSLVGIKNLKNQHTWRLEFDVFEQDGNKIKTLVDKMDKSFYMVLVPIEDDEAIDI